SVLNPEVEYILSCTAYMAERAAANGIPFEVMVNARKSGEPPYFFMAEGQGRSHYVQTLEMLARIHPQTMLVPYPKMLYETAAHLTKPKTIVLIGDIPAETHDLISQLEQRHQTILYIDFEPEGAVLRTWRKDMVYFAE